MPVSILQGDALTIPSDALICPLSKHPESEKRSRWKKSAPFRNLAPSAPLSADEVVCEDAPADLPVRKIIYLALPAVDSGKPQLSRQSLRRALLRVLRLADSLELVSVSLPLEVFAGEKYLRPETAGIIRSAVRDFLKASDMDVRLVISSPTILPFRPAFHEELDDYIGEKLVSPPGKLQKQRQFSAQSLAEEEPDILFDGECLSPTAALPELEDWIGQLDESFSETLLRLIAKRGKSEVEVYKKANLDRKLFSKIRSKKDYTPKKTTILSLCIALELNLEETRDLLSRAGYALSHASVGDIIVEYFILRENYDLFRINETLFYYDQALLGC